MLRTNKLQITLKGLKAIDYYIRAVYTEILSVIENLPCTNTT